MTNGKVRDFEVITVGGNAIVKRGQKVLEAVFADKDFCRANGLSEQIQLDSVASLDEVQKFLGQRPRLLRLFEGAQTQALTWIGAKGRVATDAAVLGMADAVIESVDEPARALGILPQATVSAVAHQKVEFDTSGACLLIGATDEARAFAASFTRFGIKKVMIVDVADHKSEKLAEILRRRLLGIEIVAVPRLMITQIPAEASVAVNLASKDETSLMEDVAYLNFLRSKGLWIDWSEATVERNLSEEIQSAGAQIFSADFIRQWRDAWCFEAMTGLRAELWQQKMVQIETNSRPS